MHANPSISPTLALLHELANTRIHLERELERFDPGDFFFLHDPQGEMDVCGNFVCVLSGEQLQFIFCYEKGRTSS